MNSIPMSQLIGTNPSVLGTGGNPLSLNGVLLTEDPSIPIGTVHAFSTLAAVNSWFGTQAAESVLASRYFSGFTGADSLPNTLYFAQYNVADVAAYLRSGSLAATSLAALQGFSGGLTITIDGRVVTSAAINLAGATSFSNAAVLIQAGLQTVGGVFTGTGTVTNGSPILTVNTTTTGQLHIGDTVVGTNIPAATTIISFGTYTTGSGVGTVNLSANATGAAGPEAITVTSAATVTYDPLRAAFVVHSPTTGVASTIGFATGTLAAHILLTLATGAVTSQGAVATNPAAVMNAVVAATQNWVTFSTVFDLTADIPTALGFAAWASSASPAGQGRFLFVEWDANLAETTGPAPTSFGAQVAAASYNGVMPNFDLTAGQKAAFVMGMIASIDFTETQGRITLAYKGQAGLTPDVIDASVASNLAGTPYGSGGNAYNFYGAFATANQAFQFLQPGSMPGVWKWVDAYVNQIAMSADFQLAMAELETQVKSIPYNTTGYNLVRAALMDPITKYVNFGAIQPGVALSDSQRQQVNTAAGTKIDGVLSTVGWYLQILPASALVRGLRGSPPMKFWYTDGGSIQSLFLATVDVE